MVKVNLRGFGTTFFLQYAACYRESGSPSTSRHYASNTTIFDSQHFELNITRRVGDMAATDIGIRKLPVHDDVHDSLFD